MVQANFKFISDAGESFTVVSFTATEGISQLYRYEIELKALQSHAIEPDDIFNEPVTFISMQNDQEHRVHGILASFDEMQTAQGYVYYQAVMVPTLWKLSLYKTNEIYTSQIPDLTVKSIIDSVITAADPSGEIDFDVSQLIDTNFLKRDYICQFGESDFDFISRLMENEGVFYYFDQTGPREKVVFVNDLDYLDIADPALIYESGNLQANPHRQVNAWICRRTRLAEKVSVRDYDPGQPSADISSTFEVETMTPVDSISSSTEYQYGGKIMLPDEAANLAEIRAQEMYCRKTRYYGESTIKRMQAGYAFTLDQHDNPKYNGVRYLITEVTHAGQNLDSTSGDSEGDTLPNYRNSFTAIDAAAQYRPPRITPKPRFYGTMTAFIYAESGTQRPEIDPHGRYRVLLPFDRADGNIKDLSNTDRKASAWIRMAQPYVGQDQGMYFPLTGNTEVLLTFINGDPDQPIITAAVPNGSQPSLLEDNPEWAQSVTMFTCANITGNQHNISMNSARTRIEAIESEIAPSQPIPDIPETHFINEGVTIANGSITTKGTYSMIPPWSGYAVDDTSYVPSYNDQFVSFKYYNKDFVAVDMTKADHIDTELVSTDRAAGDQYVYANARTFVYPQHERVYFIGSFHEDFHLKDDFITNHGTDDAPVYNSGTGIREQFNFPKPGGNFPPGTNPVTSGDEAVNPSGIRGVAEDKRWGDQMNFGWGRSFNWGGGLAMGDGGSFAEINYGNSYTENLQTLTGGTSTDSDFPYGSADDPLKDQWNYSTTWKPDTPTNIASNLCTAANVLQFLNVFSGGIINSTIRTWADGGAGDFGDMDELIQNTTAYTFSFNTASPDNLDYSAGSETLKTAWHMNPEHTAAEKTFGHKYEYHMGLTCEVHEGNTYSRNYGDTDEYIVGTVYSVTEGDSVTSVSGTCSEAFVGRKYEFDLSSTDTMVVGLSNEYKLAGESAIIAGLFSEFKLAGEVGVHIGGTAEAFLGLSAEAALAIKAEAFLGGTLAKTNAFKVESGPGETEIQAVGGAIKKADLAKVENSTFKSIISALYTVS